MVFTTQNLTPRIGVSITTDPDTLLGGAHAARLRELLEQRGVVIFPGISVSDAQQVAFARTIGDVIPQGDKGILKITLDAGQNVMADYLRSTVYWHFDGFTDDVPTRASMLSARKLSATGGQTEFANTYAAFEDLPKSRQQYLEKLRVVHTMEAIQRLMYTHPTPKQEEEWSRHSNKVHPLVWTHQSGRKSLLLGSSASYIEGMDPAEGRALLAELLEWATQPQFVYHHEWSLGDLLIWDNTGVLHRVIPYPADSGRLMHRTTLVGEEATA